jgi:NAD(P)H-dependent flavin oxidoreductase YrpB (nitropropane dioxygenase family)
MNVAAGPELAAAVTNAGGLGVIGGVGYTPKILRQQVSMLIILSLWPFPAPLILCSVNCQGWTSVRRLKL